MRLRSQLALAVTAVVALVVALAGLVVVVRADHRDRAALDTTLALRAEQVRVAAARDGSLPTDGSYVLRLIADGALRKQVGSSAGFPLPAQDGYSTVEAGDDEWRSLSQTLVTGAQLQVLISLDDLADQHTDNVLTVDLLVLLAALLSAAGVWFATGLVLRPFQRLLTSARELDPADPEQRLPEAAGPREVAELSAAMNDLLDRARAGRRRPVAADTRAGDGPAPAASMPAAPVAPAPAAAATSTEAPEVADQTSGEPTPASGASAGADAPAGKPAGRDPAAQPARAAADPTIEMPRTPPPLPEPAAGTPRAETPPSEPPTADAPRAEAPRAETPAADPGADLRPRLADLGATLDTLLDNPEMPATQRHLLLAAMADEHRRMVELVDGLRPD